MTNLSLFFKSQRFARNALTSSAVGTEELAPFLETAIAAAAAIRLFQRRPEVKPVNELWYMEVLSSTEWSLNTSANRFNPNTFVEVGRDGVEAKISALAAYRGVMRDYPHPRSREAIEGLAAYRGAQAGQCYAEAFECVFRRY